MPLKLNVGLSKKIGQPDYGSLGASCNVEVELDSAMLFDDPDAFHERTMNAYAACRQAVEDQLARQQVSSGQDSTDGKTASSTATRHSHDSSNGHRATQRQLDYARQLAGQIRGLGVDQLEDLAETMFSKSLADLSSLDASGLIDTLKEIKAGKIELQGALGGAAA